MYRRLHRVGGWQFDVHVLGDKAAMTVIKDERFVHQTIFSQKDIWLYDLKVTTANLSDSEISVIDEVRHDMLPRPVLKSKYESLQYNDFDD